MFLTTMLGTWVTVTTEYEIFIGTMDTVPVKGCTPLLKNGERYADDTKISMFERAF